MNESSTHKDRSGQGPQCFPPYTPPAFGGWKDQGGPFQGDSSDQGRRVDEVYCSKPRLTTLGELLCDIRKLEELVRMGMTEIAMRLNEDIFVKLNDNYWHKRISDLEAHLSNKTFPADSQQ